jgi:hypothetical protein
MGLMLLEKKIFHNGSCSETGQPVTLAGLQTINKKYP